MHHSFLDQLSHVESPLSRWDARPKTVTTLIFVACMATLPSKDFLQLAIYSVIMAIAWATSRLPVRHLAKRITVVLPFILIISFSAAFTRTGTGGKFEGAELLFITLRSVLAIGALTLLSSTTPFSSLLSAFRSMHVPQVMLSIMSFLYNFAFVIVDEFERLNIGRMSREFDDGIRLSWKGRAWMVGAMVTRSMERSERVYNAMLARGYDGTERSFSSTRNLPGTVDMVFGALLSALIILIRNL